MILTSIKIQVLLIPWLMGPWSGDQPSLLHRAHTHSSNVLFHMTELQLLYRRQTDTINVELHMT